MLFWERQAVAIGALAAFLFFVLLIFKYRWRCQPKLTWPQIFLAAIMGGGAVYKIVWVMFGRGATGWP